MLNYKNNVPGYFTDLDLDVVARIAKLAPQKGIVVEIGAHFGRSTVAWADNVLDKTKIFVVDPWDAWEWPIPAPRECIPKELRDVKDDPRKWHEGDVGAIPMSLDDAFLNRYTVFKYFTDKYQNIYPVQDKSPPVTQQLNQLKLIDIVFLDGDHSEKGIEQDLNFWFPRLKKNGILCGHDYTQNHFKMVNKIQQFSKIHRWPLWENPLGSNLWIMGKEIDTIKNCVLENKTRPSKTWLQLMYF